MPLFHFLNGGNTVAINTDQLVRIDLKSSGTETIVSILTTRPEADMSVAYETVDQAQDFINNITEFMILGKDAILKVATTTSDKKRRSGSSHLIQ